MSDERKCYLDPEAVDHAEALKVFAGDDAALIAETIVGLALHDEDGDWVETQCWLLADHADPGVRGTAGLCLGHIARLGHVRRRSWSIASQALRGRVGRQPPV